MFEVDDLLAMMNAGISTDEIASNFAEALNAAQEQKKIEEEKAVRACQEKEDQAAKIADTNDLLDIARDYLKKWYPNVTIKEDTSAENLIEFLDTILELNVQFKQLGDMFGKSTHKRSKVDPIESFLRSFGL